MKWNCSETGWHQHQDMIQPDQPLFTSELQKSAYLCLSKQKPEDCRHTNCFLSLMSESFQRSKIDAAKTKCIFFSHCFLLYQNLLPTLPTCIVGNVGCTQWHHWRQMIRFHAASSGTTNTLNYFFDIWITSQDLYILLIVYDWWSHTFILCFFFCFYIFVRCIFGVCYLWVTTKGDCWSSTEFPCNYCIKSQWPLTDVFLDTVTTILVVI